MQATRPRFRPRRPRRVSALLLAMGLGLSTPTASDAFLTELLVGGTVAFQVLGIVGEALPQVAALAKSVETLVKSGKETAGTVEKIIDMIFGGKGKKDGGKKGPATRSAPAGKKPDPMVLPDLRPGGGAADELAQELEGGAEEETSSVPPAEVEGEDALDRLVQAHARRKAIQGALEVASEEQKGALGLGLLQITKAYESQVDALLAELRGAARENDRDALRRFAERVRKLPPESEAAVDPVLEQLGGRGEQFRQLHADPAERAAARQEERALAPLRSFHRARLGARARRASRSRPRGPSRSGR